MKRPWHIAAAFGASLLLLLAATAWMSWTTLRLDRAEAEARAQTALEEHVRLALWRMDSALAPLMAEERARPYFVYSAFYPAEAAYTRMFSQLELGQVLIPSPLLATPAPYVLLHFQFDAAGDATSPQVPTGRLRRLAMPAYVTENQLGLAEALLGVLREQVAFGLLLAALPPPPPAGQAPAVAAPAPLAQRSTPQPQPRAQPELDTERNAAEYQARAQQVQQQLQQRMAQTAANNTFAAASDEVRQGVFEARWVNGQLLLARRIAVNGEEYVQGVWLEWAGLRAGLLNSVADLLPGAQLEPANDSGAGGTHQRLLAGLPVRLIAPAPAVAAAPGRPEVWRPLLIAWGCVILATVAVGALLAGTVALSERRAAFVSAVTHELRTPLTTFRLYSEMLTTGMVTDETTRSRYFETLHGEAVRLSHLVENVLAYARLERRRAPTPCAPLPVVELVERMESRLCERAQQADMELVVDGAAAEGSTVCADPAAVEQILFNLVDNACKYAAAATDRRIHLTVDVTEKRVRLRVSDHGPGVTRLHSRRLFAPFHKPATEAANSAPGVGLGLALSRRLARAMGGDLRLEPTRTGTCFALDLPRCG